MWREIRGYIPNTLSLLRVVAVPIIYTIEPYAEWWWYAIIVFGSFLTDILDGFLARLWKLKSAWGKFFDTNADKVFVIANLEIFTRKHELPFEIFVAITVREVLIGILRWLELVPEVKGYGKIKMWFQCILILFLPLQELGYISKEIVHPFGYITAGITVFTGILYLIPNKKAPQ